MRAFGLRMKKAARTGGGGVCKRPIKPMALGGGKAGLLRTFIG